MPLSPLHLQVAAMEHPGAEKKGVAVGIDQPDSGIVADLLARQAESQGV